MSADDERSAVRIELRQMALFAALVSFAPVLAAFMVGLVWDGGDSASTEYYVTVAQVAPVLFLAGIVESRARGARDVRRWEDDPTMQAVAFGPVLYYVFLFVSGEGFALYAVAAGARSTFLTLAPAFAMVALLGAMLVDLFESLSLDGGMR